MGHRGRALLLLWGFGLCPAVFAFQIDRIDIDSSWIGLFSIAPGHTTILRTGKGYTSNGRLVDERLVKDLSDALNDHEKGRPSLALCGITEQWLSQNYQQALVSVVGDELGTLSSKQVELFRSHFTNRQSAQAAFNELFKGIHTDDYPKVSVRVRSGGAFRELVSNSQHPFMLPWSGVGYSCRASRAIAALMPDTFPNRDRLSLGDSFRSELSREVMQSIGRAWDFLETEHRIGPDIAAVLARFTPLDSAISNVFSIDLDGDRSWNAKLRSADLPANLVLGVSLRFRERPLPGVDELLRQVPRYAHLVLSVPWLREYLNKHPSTTLELRYVNGLSLSPQARQTLIGDLRDHGKSSLAGLITRMAADCAFVEIQGHSDSSRAVVLPSKEVLLWHFKGGSTLGFRGTNLEAWGCYGWRCTGTLISVDGSIVK